MPGQRQTRSKSSSHRNRSKRPNARRKAGSPRTRPFGPSEIERRLGTQGALAWAANAQSADTAESPSRAAPAQARRTPTPAETTRPSPPTETSQTRPEAPTSDSGAAAEPVATQPIAVQPSATQQSAAPQVVEAETSVEAVTSTEGAGEIQLTSGAADTAPQMRASQSPLDAIAPAVAAVNQRASAQVSHPPAAQLTSETQAAAITPSTEQRRSAAAGTVTQFDNAEPQQINQGDFISKLREALRKAVPEPRNADEATELMDEGAGRASAEIESELSSQSQAAAGPLAAAADPAAELAPGSQPAPLQSDLAPVVPGSVPEAVSPDAVVPEPLPAEQLDYSSDRSATDTMMSENNVTQEQLERANEPDFGATVQSRQEAEANEASAPARYREREEGARADTRQQASAALTDGVQEFYGSRMTRVGQVAEEQTRTHGMDSSERDRVTAEIERIKDTTRSDVQGILEEMESTAKDVFGDGLERAEEDYKEVFDEEKGGFWAGVGDFFTGGHDERITRAFNRARSAYDREVTRTINRVASYVEAALARAKARVAAGRREVDDYVASLDGALRQHGEQAQQRMTAEFDAMVEEVDQRRDSLVDTLAQTYAESRSRLQDLEETLREENKSLRQRVYDATVGVINTIIEFKNLLLGVLARAAAVIESIILDPIGFLLNLVAGVKAGLNLFVSNIVEHLKAGLMGWLFGAIASAGIELPEKFDLKGIFGLIFQILGLTYDAIRERAVRIVGEPIVARLEQVAEIFIVLKNEGLAGLWEMLKEKVLQLKDAVMEQIQDWVITRIVKAGITWIIGLLNPAAAFIKACKAIYDIVIFFIERGRQILDLVNAVIDSLAAIVAGNLQAMARAVEGALARVLPVAISFLAALLGLGGISDKIRKIIETIRRPIGRAVDWIIRKAVKIAKKVGRLFGIGREEGREGAEAEEDGDSTDLASMPIPRILAQTPAPAQRSAEEKIEDFNGAKLVLGRIVSESESTEDVALFLDALIRRFGLKSVEYTEGGDLEISLNPKATIESGKLAADGDSMPPGHFKMDVSFYPGSLSLGNGISANVGKEMVAKKLGPNHPQGAGPKGGALRPLFKTKTGGGPLPTQADSVESKYVKGHLLNDNIGGPGDAENLFPITEGANRRHVNGFEKQVKKWVNDDKYWVFYSVKVVIMKAEGEVVNADFVCKAYPLNMDGDEAKGKIEKTIRSRYKGVPADTQTVDTSPANSNLPDAYKDEAFGASGATPELSSRHTALREFDQRVYARVMLEYASNPAEMREVLGDVRNVGDKTMEQVADALRGGARLRRGKREHAAIDALADEIERKKTRR